MSTRQPPEDPITFLVGANQTPFEIRRVFIRAGTYLARFMQGAKRKFKKLSGNKRGYLLPDLDADHFAEFYSFLRGANDFRWNPSIAAFFEAMGYPNTMGYPLDFFKVKLIDNWIRDNFYRFKLWDPSVTEPALYISRGPYVGLIDITESLSQGYVNVPHLDPKELNNLPIDYTKAIVAGGALIQYFYGSTKKPSDGNSVISHVINNFVVPFRAPEYPNLLLTPESYDDLLGKKRIQIEERERQKKMPPIIARSENATTIGRGRGRYQVIHRLYTCPSEVVHGFDLDASGILWDGRSVWVTHRADYSLRNKVNFLDFARFSETYENRLAKYAARGFRVWLPDYDQALVRWNDLARLKEAIVKEGVYEMEEGESFGMDSLAIEKAPYFDLNTFSTIAMRASQTYSNVLEKANPLDIFIMALYFRYHPTGKENPFKKGSDYSPEILVIPKGNASEGFDFVDSAERDDRESRSYLQEVRTGLVIFSYDGNPVDNAVQQVLTLEADAAQESGLSQTITWKSQNPMQQLSGTFNPTSIADIQPWFNSSLFYGSARKDEVTQLLGPVVAKTTKRKKKTSRPRAEEMAYDRAHLQRDYSSQRPQVGRPVVEGRPASLLSGFGRSSEKALERQGYSFSEEEEGSGPISATRFDPSTRPQPPLTNFTITPVDVEEELDQ
jgi:hypothetical protein